MSTAAISRATRKALNKAVKAGLIPDTAYEVKLRHYSAPSSDLVTVRLAGPKPALKLFNAHYLYDTMVPASEWPAEWGGRSRATGMWSPNWYALQDDIVRALRDEHIKAGPFRPGNREEDVQVVSPQAYTSLEYIPQYRAEFAMRSREVRLLRAAFPDTYIELLFRATEAQRDAAVARAATSRYADDLDFDPSERGWRWDAGTWEKRASFDGLTAVVAVRDRSPKAEYHTTRRPMNAFNDVQAWREAVDRGLIPGLVAPDYYTSEPHMRLLPPEATHAWVVYDYRSRARRYDRLAAGWATSLETAILDAEAAAGPQLRDSAAAPMTAREPGATQMNDRYQPREIKAGSDRWQVWDLDKARPLSQENDMRKDQAEHLAKWLNRRQEGREAAAAKWPGEENIPENAAKRRERLENDAPRIRQLTDEIDPQKDSLEQELNRGLAKGRREVERSPENLVPVGGGQGSTATKVRDSAHELTQVQLEIARRVAGRGAIARDPEAEEGVKDSAPAPVMVIQSRPGTRATAPAPVPVPADRVKDPGWKDEDA